MARLVQPKSERAVFGVPRLRGLSSCGKSLKSRPRREAAVKAELQTGSVRWSNHAILLRRGRRAAVSEFSKEFITISLSLEPSRILVALFPQ